MTARKLNYRIQDWYEKGCQLEQADKLKEALVAFSAVIDRDARRAEAYFRRGVCHYLLGNCHLASNDMDAAALLGCRDAQLWSRFHIQHFDDSDEDY